MNARFRIRKLFPSIFSLMLLLALTSCTLPWQQQAQQPDPRLKNFRVVSERIIILDTQAEVDGTLQNTGKYRYPYDVTLLATFYDNSGKVVGQAQGIAEDVWPGMIRPFVLIGQVNSAQYARMVITTVSLQERRYEKNLPTPPPVMP